MNDISVAVDELVITAGRDEYGDGHRLARMTEERLKQLFEEKGLPVGVIGGEIVQLTAPNIDMPRNVSTEETAQELALALYKGLGKMR